MKISSKYEKELRKLFELSKKTYIINFQLRNEELISNFSDVTDEEKINIIKEGIKIACQKKNSTEIENLMLSISFFKLYDRSEFIEDYIKLSKEEFHEEHETIASYFQRFHLPQTIDCIYELAISNFEKYQWDDNFALVRKCCFALGDINTPKAKEKLELLLQSDEEMIREHAMEQLKRCNFTNKDVE